MLIAVEGIDGSGKTTLLTEMAGILNGLGHSVFIRSYPVYDSYIGRRLGRLLAGTGQYDASRTDPEAMALLYAIDRLQDYVDHKQEFTSSDYVLLNRYTLSSMVYQGIRSDCQTETMQWIDHLEHELLGLPRPNRYIVLDTEPHIAHERIKQKGERNYTEGQTHDTYESNADLQARAQQLYRRLSRDRTDVILTASEEHGKHLTAHELAARVLNDCGIT